jgi:hypothetical protein
MAVEEGGGEEGMVKRRVRDGWAVVTLLVSAKYYESEA